MQQINLLLASLPDGILLGFVYGLAAMGLTLIWGVMNVINLSHGPIIALGMFGTFFIFTQSGDQPICWLGSCGYFRIVAWSIDLRCGSPPSDQRTSPFLASRNIFRKYDHYRTWHCRSNNIPLQC